LRIIAGACDRDCAFVDAAPASSIVFPIILSDGLDRSRFFAFAAVADALAGYAPEKFIQSGFLAPVFQRFVDVSLSLCDPDEPASLSEVDFLREFCRNLAPQEAFVGLVWAAVGELAASPARQYVSLALLAHCVGDGRGFFAEDKLDDIVALCQSEMESGGRLPRELACELVDAFVEAFPEEAGDHVGQLTGALAAMLRAQPSREGLSTLARVLRYCAATAADATDDVFDDVWPVLAALH
jgi:hypothetical protein